MSVAETQTRPIFGQITAEDMRKNQLLLKAVYPAVKKACDHSRGRFSAEAVFDGLIAGEFKLWGVLRPPARLEAVVVTRVDGNVFEVLAIGHEALEFLSVLSGEARAARCAKMRIVGPKLWQRKGYIAPDFQNVGCLYEKDLAAR